jgi:preprotein translocase subunit SecG
MSFWTSAAQHKQEIYMETLQTLLFVLQIIVAVTLIGFVLIQHGKGADTGAAFGSGASSTVFGSRGSGNFLTRTTTVLAVIFLGNSLLLGYLSSNMIRNKGSLLDTEPASITQPLGSQVPKEGTTSPSPASTTTATAPQDKPTDMPQGSSNTAPSDVPVMPAPAETPATSDIPEVPK